MTKRTPFPAFAISMDGKMLRIFANGEIDGDLLPQGTRIIFNGIPRLIEEACQRVLEEGPG